MTLNNSNDAIIERRRELVANFLLRKLSQRQIVDGLARAGLFNPDTGEPYSLGTVNGDIKAIKAEWRTLRRNKLDRWMEEELASLDNLEKAAWAQNDLELVRRIRADRRKVIGLDKQPDKEAADHEVTIRVVYDGKEE